VIFKWIYVAFLSYNVINKMKLSKIMYGQSSDHEDWGVGLKLIDCWGQGLESRCGDEYSSVVFLVCCVGSGFCDELITLSEESYCVCVCVCVCVRVCVSDIETSAIRWHAQVGLFRHRRDKKDILIGVIPLCFAIRQ